MEPEILTVGEVAKLMRVSRDTVYRLAVAGELPGRRVGRIWRFPKDAIQSYLHGVVTATAGRPGMPRALRDDRG
jgi:excisionase family DNA binding protein